MSAGWHPRALCWDCPAVVRFRVPATPPRLHLVYSNLLPQTREAAHRESDATGGSLELHWTGDDDEHYWRTLCEIWSRGEGFVLMEHDARPWRGALAPLWYCPEPWCAYPNDFGLAVGTTLLFTKFATELVRAIPTLWERAGRRSMTYPARHYATVDVAMNEELRQLGFFAPHRHFPRVDHPKWEVLSYKGTCGRCGVDLPGLWPADFTRLKVAYGSALCEPCGGPYWCWTACLAQLSSRRGVRTTL